MSKWIVDQLRQVEEYEANSANVNYGVSKVPFILFRENGDPFYTYGFMKGCIFRTPFFTVKSINRFNHSAVLTLLVPHPSQKNEIDFFNRVDRLIRTELSIIVDLSNFCSLAFIPMPIDDYLIICDPIKNKFTLPFELRNNNVSETIWSAGEKPIKNTATITLWYRYGSDKKLIINVITKEKVVNLIVSKGEIRAVTVRDLRNIKIQPPRAMVSGVVEIEFNSFSKRKISLI